MFPRCASQDSRIKKKKSEQRWKSTNKYTLPITQGTIQKGREEHGNLFRASACVL